MDAETRKARIGQLRRMAKRQGLKLEIRTGYYKSYLLWEGDRFLAEFSPALRRRRGWPRADDEATHDEIEAYLTDPAERPALEELVYQEDLLDTKEGLRGLRQDAGDNFPELARVWAEVGRLDAIPDPAATRVVRTRTPRVSRPNPSPLGRTGRALQFEDAPARPRTTP
jgi:hypothetical protein